MTNDVDEDDRDSDDDSFDEDPLPSDQDPAEEVDVEETVPCPFCKKRIHENADVCNHCHNYVASADTPGQRVPVMIWLGVILAGLCVLAWVLL